MNAINGDLYVFGGLVSADKLAGDEIHVLVLSNLDLGTLGSQYKVIPALARNGDDVPTARAGHAACTVDDKIVMYGGFSDPATQKPINEGGRVWLFDPASSHWSHLDVANERFPSLCYHSAAVHGRKFIVHGGYSDSPDSARPATDTWAFDLDSRVWTELPALPKDVEGMSPMLPSAPPSLAVADDRLYIVAGSSDLGSQIYILNLASEQPAEWTTLEFPTNPLTAGPRPRKGAGLVPIKTGLGRTYLLLMLGEKEEFGSTAIEKQASAGSDPQFWSGLWVLQVASKDNTPAQVKDIAREKLPNMDSHEGEWAEVVLELDDVKGIKTAGGRSHPGPRGYFGCDVLDAKKVALWGGLNPSGGREGDGWVVDLKM